MTHTTDLTTPDQLQQRNAIAHLQVAEALRLEDARKKARVIQQIKAREADIVQSMEEVFSLMKKYGLTRQDILDSRQISPSRAAKTAMEMA